MKLNKIKKINRDSPAYPIIIAVLLELFLHAFFLGRSAFGDDFANRSYLDNQSLITFSKNIYETWSSRIFINGLVPVIARLNPWVWRILDVGMIAIFLWSVSKLIVDRRKYTCNCILAALFLLYPFSHQNTAGWISTTISYLWPLCLGTYAFVPMKKAMSEETVHWWEYILCGASAVFACNAEQNAVIILVISVAFLIYALKTKKKYYVQILLIAAASANLLLHLTCPGNALRNIKATAELNPDFFVLTPVEKLQLGFSETVSRLLFSPNLVFLFLLILIAVVILSIKKKRNSYGYVTALVPLSAIVAEGFLPDITERVFPEFAIFTGSAPYSKFGAMLPYGGLVTAANSNSIDSYIPLFVMVVCVLLAAVGIFVSMDGTPRAILAVLVYLCGIGGGMIMGFSPTLYASSMRPYTVVYGCMMITIMLIINDNIDGLSQLRYGKAAKLSLYVASGFTFMWTIIQTAQISYLVE